VFMFSPEAKVSYVGVDYARGIKCNQWYADGTEDQTVDGHKLTITSKRNHWFSTQDWSDANCVESMLDAEGNKWDCSTQIPVRIVSEGKIYNHTTKMTTKFHDHYEYIGVIVGKAPEYMFDATGVCTAAIAKKNFPEKALSSGSNSNNNNNNGNSNGKSLRSPGALGASDLISKTSKKSAGGGSGTGAGVIVGSLFAVVIALAAVAFVVKKKGRRSNMALNGGGGSGGHRRFVDDDGLNNGRLTVPVVQSGMITSEGQGLNASNLAAV